MKKRKADIRHIFQRLLYDVNIRPKLVAFFLVFSILPLLVSGIFTCAVNIQHMESREYIRLQQAMEQKMNTLDFFLTAYTNKCEMLSNNVELQELLYTPTEGIYDKVLCYYSVKQLIAHATEEVSYSFFPYSDYYAGALNVELFVSETSLPIDDALICPLEEYSGQDGSQGNSSLYRWSGPIVTGNYTSIALDRNLYYYSKGAEIGVIRFLIPIARLESVMSSNEPFDYTICIADRNFDSAILGNEQLLVQLKQDLQDGKICDGVQTITADGEKLIVGIFCSPVCGWKLICAIPQNVLSAGTRKVLIISIASLLITLILTVCFLLVISKSLTQRMQILSRKTAAVRDGNLSITEVIQGNDEIGKIDQGFNEMVYQLNQLIEREYKAKLRSNQATMELLQEQINPHLLYNSLSMIAYRAKEQNMVEIESVIHSMISFYRNVLNRGAMVTTLDKEVDIVREYLSLVTFVYDMQIESVIDVDACILDCWCIKMLLQPIVENAVLHGLRANGGGFLCITGELRNGNVCLEIMNDGKALSNEELDILDKICAGEKVASSGYALKNIILRLRLFFGSRFTMKYKRMVDGCTSVEIEFPKYTKEEMEAMCQDVGD